MPSNHTAYKQTISTLEHRNEFWFCFVCPHDFCSSSHIWMGFAYMVSEWVRACGAIRKPILSIPIKCAQLWTFSVPFVGIRRRPICMWIAHLNIKASHLLEIQRTQISANAKWELHVPPPSVCVCVLVCFYQHSIEMICRLCVHLSSLILSWMIEQIIIVCSRVWALFAGISIYFAAKSVKSMVSMSCLSEERVYDTYKIRSEPIWIYFGYVIVGQYGIISIRLSVTQTRKAVNNAPIKVVCKWP